VSIGMFAAAAASTRTCGYWRAIARRYWKFRWARHAASWAVVASFINRPVALHLSYYSWTDLSQLLNSAPVFQPDTNLRGDINHGRALVEMLF
jgi:hypothetical protein